MTAPRIAWLAGGLALASIGAASAEIRAMPPSSPVAGPELPLVPPGPLRLECWQYGVKIIDRSHLAELQAAPSLAALWLSLREAGPGDGTVIVMPLGETICLASREREGAR